MTVRSFDDGKTLAERVIALERQRGAALVSRDVDRLANMLADDYVYIHASGKMDNKASYVEAQRSGAYVFLEFKYEDLHVRVYHGLVAVLTGRMRNWVRRNTETKMNDHRIQIVWVRPSDSSDDWRCASYGASAIAAS